MENVKFKKGNYYYYKNQYMEDAIKLHLIDKEEWGNGEIDSLEFKKPDGYRLTLKKNDIKYITTSDSIVDGYAFEKKFKDFVNSEISETPKQIFGIIKSIDRKEIEGVSTMAFTEEVKDGRQKRFNVSIPLRLKGKQFSYKGIVFNIKDIKHIGENIQPSDYNEYIDNNYSIAYFIQYIDKMNDGGKIKSNGVLKPTAYAKESGNSGEKFSYQKPNEIKKIDGAIAVVKNGSTEIQKDAKSGGLLIGKAHADEGGGIKAVVVEDNRPILIESGEVIINKHAAKKHWRKLNEINQSAGNGAAIHEPQFAKGATIESLNSEITDFINKNESVLKSGYVSTKKRSAKHNSITIISYNSGQSRDMGVINTVNSSVLVKTLATHLSIDKQVSAMILASHIGKAKRLTLKDIENVKSDDFVIIDRDSIACHFNSKERFDAGATIYKGGKNVYVNASHEDMNEYTLFVKKQIESEGYYVSSPSYSKTKFGNSNYLYVDTQELGNSVKVRVSDHSVTNLDRMFNEIHLHYPPYSGFLGSSENLIKQIHFRLQKDKYFKDEDGVEEYIVRMDVNEKDLRQTDKILSERLSTGRRGAGRKIFAIERINKKQVVNSIYNTDNKIFRTKDKFKNGGGVDLVDYINEGKTYIVSALRKDGRRQVKIFNEEVSNLDVYNYFKDELNIEIVDSSIEIQEHSGFDAVLFLRAVNELCLDLFGHEIKDSEELIFSFNSKDLSVYDFVCELEDSSFVDIEMIDGDISATRHDIFDKGGVTSVQKTNLNNRIVSKWSDIPAIWKKTQNFQRISINSFDPKDKALQKISSVFCGKDELRPIISGVFFDEFGFVATDAHKLFFKQGKHLLRGIYPVSKIKNDKVTLTKKGLIDGNYPRYQQVIPTKTDFVCEIDVLKLYTYVIASKNYQNNVTHQINFAYGKDNIYAYNSSFLAEVLETFLALGETTIYAGLLESASRAAIFSPDKDVAKKPHEAFSKKDSILVLLMPVMAHDDFKGATDLLSDRNNQEVFNSRTENSCYFDFKDNEIHNEDGSIVKINEDEELYPSYINSKMISVVKVFTENNNSRIPILDYAEIKNGTLYVTNLETSASISVSKEVEDGTYSYLDKYLRKGEMDTDEYPSHPELGENGAKKNVAIVSLHEFLEQLNYANLFVGKDDFRPAMNCVNLIFNENKMQIMATDNQCLYKNEISVECKLEKEVITMVSPKTVAKILSIFDDQPLIINCDERRFSITGYDFEIVGRKSDSKYPDGNSLIPYSSNILIEFQTEDLLIPTEKNDKSKLIFVGESIKIGEEIFKGRYKIHKLSEPKIINQTRGIYIGSVTKLKERLSKINSSSIDVYVSDKKGFNNSNLLWIPLSETKSVRKVKTLIGQPIKRIEVEPKQFSQNEIIEVWSERLELAELMLDTYNLSRAEGIAWREQKELAELMLN